MIEKINIIDLETKETIFLTDGKNCILTETTDYSHTRDLQTLPLERWSYSKEINIFVPQTIKFEFRSYQILDELKKSLRKYDGEYLLEIKKRKEMTPIYAKIKLESDSINFLGIHVLQHLSMSFLRTSMWFRQIELFHNVMIDSREKKKYTYTYPITYTGNSKGNYDFSKVRLFNKGDISGTLDCRILGEAENPVIRCDNNEYKTESVYLGKNDVLEIKNSPKEIGIFSNIPNIESKRDFSKKTFIDIPRGEIFLEFENINKVEVILYEYYYNI